MTSAAWHEAPRPILPAADLSAVEAARRHRDLGAFGGKRIGNRKTDAAARADHQCDPALDVEFHRPGVLDPAHGHVAILRQHAGMVAVGGARRLQNILPAIAGLLDQPDGLGEIRSTRAERHGGAAKQPVFHMHIENARRVGRNLLGGIIAERGAVAAVVIDAEHLAREFVDELRQRCGRQIGFEDDLDALLR